MRIAVCVKCVPDSESVYLNADHSVDLSSATWQISPYDLNAIEAAVQLKEKNSDVGVIAVTAGGSIVDDSRRRKDILSRGVEKLFCVQSDELQGQGADSYFTARTLAETLQRIGDVDLALFGEGSGDIYAQQTGIIAGALLGWPVLNGVCSIELDGDKLIVKRNLENSIETLRVQLPAVLCVTADINTPRFTSVRDTLAAGKKPFEIWPLQDVVADANHGSETVSVLGPEDKGRKQEIYPEMNDEAREALAALLRKFL